MAAKDTYGTGDPTVDLNTRCGAVVSTAMPEARMAEATQQCVATKRFGHWR